MGTKHGSEIHTVDANGHISSEGRCFVSEALVGRRVWLQRFDDRALVVYRHMLIRELDLRTGRSAPILKPYGPIGPSRGRTS